MAFSFTQKQREALHHFGELLETPRARGWQAREAEATKNIRALLGEEFQGGLDLTEQQLDELFGYMRNFSANRNINRLLYEVNGLQKMSGAIRDLLFSSSSLADRVNRFLGLESMGLQTLSQFLVAYDPVSYAFDSAPSWEGLGISAEQYEVARKEMLERHSISSTDLYLGKTLEYLTDSLVFQRAREELKLEFYSDLNIILWLSRFEDGQELEQIKEVVGIVERGFGSETEFEIHLATNWKAIPYFAGFDIVKGSKPHGGQYPVGNKAIDLLAYSESHKMWLVLELKTEKNPDTYEAVGQVQTYMGFVQEKLAKAGDVVRGLVITGGHSKDIEMAVSVIPSVGWLVYSVRIQYTDFRLSDPLGKAASFEDLFGA